MLLARFKFSCSVIGLTETWFSDQTPAIFSLANYNLVVNNRSNQLGGGVGMYILRQHDYVIRSELNYMNPDIETIFVEIIVPNNKNIIVGTIYRPPRSNHNEFLNYMNEILQNPVLQNKRCFLMGDFNINLLNNHSDVFTQNFLDTLVTESFLPLITKPTRVQNNSSTLVDLYTLKC